MNVSFFDVFKIFFIIGIQLLGGGYVIIPLIKKYIVDERNWISNEELVDFFTMSQCIPGIIAGNIAICIGYKAKGFLGAIAAISGIILPCLLFIILIANFLTEYISYPVIQSAFKGIRVSVIILILVTIKDLWKDSVNSLFSYFLFFVILLSLFYIPVSPAIIIICSGIMGYIYGLIKRIKNV